MDVFMIKLLVLAVLAVLFALTIWVSGRLFSAYSKAAAPVVAKTKAPVEPALDPATRTGDP
jgi:hypothetical protein